MAEKVIFDGNTSIVLVDDSVLLIDAESELYSAWKRWCVVNTGGFSKEGLQYEAFFRTVAGDPIRPGKALGAHFFITNNSLIRPWLGNHELTVEGNLWSEPGEVIFTTVTGNATVLATVERAADAYQLIITGSGGGDGFGSADRTTIDETHDALGEFTGSAIIATVPAVITGTLVTEQKDWLEDIYDAVGVFTGSAIIATVPAVITGTLTTEQATMLNELWYLAGLATGTPLEVSPETRRVIGILQQTITYDSPTTGTTYVLRTG